MRFSVWPDPTRPWSEVLDIAEHCDRAGWYGVWFADHFMPNDPTGATPLDGPTLECFAVMSALAARTTQARIGSLVVGNLYRHPAVVANAAATIDQISGGRFVLGLGAGWQVNEHAAYGIDLLSVKDRLDHLEDACRAITSLLREPRTTVEGSYRITDAPCDPKPVQQPLPLLVGGKGEQRTMRIAARHADEWNAWTTADELRAKNAVLDRHCEAIGRDPAEIARSTQALVFLSTDETWLAKRRGRNVGRPEIVGTPAEVVEQVAAYADAGCDELIVPDWTMGPAGRAKDTLDLFLTEVVPALP